MPSARMIGTRLSHYEISARLGEGGMGVVYRAIDTRLNRTVALKVISRGAVLDPALRQRFAREARAASSLNHPNIVTIHDVGESEGVDFLVMELVGGRSLEALIPTAGMPVEQALDCALAIAQALAAAHAGGIIHRDIKPANVMLTGSGVVKVLDFGVAKRVDLIGADGSTMAETVATEAGMTVGTLRYMSPEQARGLPVDPRSDVFSFGALLYEMLAGRPAFGGGTALGTLASILGDAPIAIETIRPEVPAPLAALLREMLAKDRDARPAAATVAARLSALRSERTASSSDVRRALASRVVVVPAAALVVLLGLGGWWWWSSGARDRWAAAAAPRIQQLIDRDDYDGAFVLARDAVAIRPNDAQLKQLWFNVTYLTTIESTPSGADVSVRGYQSSDANWSAIGRTPLPDVRVPWGQTRVRITKDGFSPFDGTLTSFKPHYVLDRPAAIPHNMVRIPAAETVVLGRSAAVDGFWMDRFEVTNREFKAFVDRGGYRSREFWTQPFADGTGTLTWEQAMTRFRDTTGRPGPSTWELGSYPEGADDLPVEGVSWYEAAAYAASVQKSLPTVFHWRSAAGLYGFTENFAEILLLSNFRNKGAATVGSSKGISPFGTYDMAGNVKEWCWNEARGGRMILGGGWNEESYMFHDQDAQAPMQRLPAYGIRLVKYADRPTAAASARIEPSVRDYATEHSVSDEVFEVARSLYRYDAMPLNARLEQVEETTVMRKETAAFDAAYGGERVRVYLYLPRNARPPYQTVVFFPGGDAPLLRSSRELRLNAVDFVIRSGRAVLYPVWAGTYERAVQTRGGSTFRDLTIARGKDMQRCMEYLLTRTDIDHDKLAFYGISLGAFNGVIFTAIEPRFKASVLSGGGMSETRRPVEIDPITFAPRVRVPTLMVNGRFDFSNPVETMQRPLFDLLGTPPADKRHEVLEGGHIPVRMHDVIRVILDWYDRYLGPVTPP
ncbi:MAG: protein kinase [Vicinamibacterales bacterium]